MDDVSKIAGAIGYITPGKTMPDFKFRMNGGRAPLQTGVDSIAKFYAGWSLFLKDAVTMYEAVEIGLLEGAATTTRGKSVNL